MKDSLTRFTRNILPASALHVVETAYRKGRAKLVGARYGYPAKNLRVIAITGTNGKTTTACYINEILKEAKFKTALFSTALIEVAGEAEINNLNVTVASASRMQRFFNDARRAGVDYVIIEATSHALDQHKLDGVPIEAAIMTNLTQDHLDYHKTMEQYAAAKARLFKLKPRYVVLNRDDEWFEYFDKFEAGAQKMTYGEHEESEAKIVKTKLYRRGTEADIVLDHQTHLELATALPGKFNVHNMAAATTLAYLLGIKLVDIQEGVANLESIPGRFERAVEGLDYDVIVDYAHTPDALEKILETVRLITKGRTILVFGACGDRDQEKRPIMGEIAAKGADRVFLTDEESYNEDPQIIRDMINEGIERAGGSAKTTEIADRREAIARALGSAKKGDTVLITGMGHEQFRIVNGERQPWNDTQVVRDVLGKSIDSTN